jgi:hypothetical protein
VRPVAEWLHRRLAAAAQRELWRHRKLLAEMRADGGMLVARYGPFSATTTWAGRPVIRPAHSAIRLARWPVGASSQASCCSAAVDSISPGGAASASPARSSVANRAASRAYDHGYQWISVDFDTANPLSRPFWLNAGFHPAGYGVLRLIDRGAGSTPNAPGSAGGH